MGEYNPKNPDAFNQVALPEPKPPGLNISPVPGGSVVDAGQFSSPNFRRSRLGWRLDSQGNAEFSGGVFRGDFTIGGTVKTIGSVVDIQEALDEVASGGGGKVYLQPGTYVLTADLDIPGGVSLEGVSRDNTIIDGNGLYCVRIEGTDAYTTGTISITNGTSAVTGVGTTFTQAMVGQYIILDGYWYEIDTVTNGTSLSLVDTFTGSDVSGDGYAIANPNFAANIRLLTIIDAPNGGIICTYASEPKFDDLIIMNCGTGMDLDYVYAPYLKVGCIGNGVGINFNYVDAFELDFCDASDSTTGAGFLLTNSGNATLFDSNLSGNLTDGANMTGCNNIAFLSLSINANGSQGVEFVSNNSDVQFVCVEFADNTSDGVKLTATSDRISVSTSSIHDNGGFGINIAASTCDNNNIIAPAFDNNTSGNISDSGTGTVVVGQERGLGSAIPLHPLGMRPLAGYSDIPALFGQIGTSFSLQLLGNTGSYQTRDYTNDWPAAQAVVSYVLLGSYLYLMLKDAVPDPDQFRVYRYDKDNIANGGSLMHFSGSLTLQDTNSAVNVNSNGRQLIFNYQAGNTINDYDLALYDISGTGAAYSSTVALGASANVATYVTGRVNGDYLALNSALTIVRRYNNSGTLQTTSPGYATSNALVMNTDFFLYLGYELAGSVYWLYRIPIT